MTIRKKITRTDEAITDVDSAREQVISRGGHVVADIESSKTKEWTTLCLRIPITMVSQIDALLEERIGLSRTAWILEAIQKTLKTTQIKD